MGLVVNITIFEILNYNIATIKYSKIIHQKKRPIKPWLLIQCSYVWCNVKNSYEIILWSKKREKENGKIISKSMSNSPFFAEVTFLLRLRKTKDFPKSIRRPNKYYERNMNSIFYWYSWASFQSKCVRV